MAATQRPGKSMFQRSLSSPEQQVLAERLRVSPTLPMAHRALESINLAGVGLDLVPVLQHLLFRLPQRVIVLVGRLCQVRHLGRGKGQLAQPLRHPGPTAPGPAQSLLPTAPWTCTTPQPQQCSWQRCSRTGLGCPAVQPSGRAWRCPSPPGCAAPAAEPAALEFPEGTR